MRKRVFAGALAMSTIAALGTALPASAAPPAAKALKAKTAKPYDFNGDGRPDLALGSPYGKVGKLSSAGFITVVYSGKNGPDTKKKKYFSQNSAGVPGTAESGDHFGYALASLDYNRDGYADLLVGVPGEDTGKGKDTGSETLIWGSKSGLSTHANAMDGYNAGEMTGSALAVGDFNNDGYSDWVDAAPGRGYYNWYTSKPGVTRAAGRTFAPQAHAVPFGRAAKRAKAPKVTGILLAVGDVNGDKKDDVLMGLQAGSASDVEIHDGATGVQFVRQIDTTVTSVAVGDFDGDGFADMAYGHTDESKGKGGLVTIVSGDADESMSVSRTISQDTAGVPGTGTKGDGFGASLAAGDIDKDGKSDLAVGVPYKVVSGKSQAGESVVLYGGVADARTQAISQSTAGVSGVAETGDRFGWAASLLDANNDGYPDAIIGSPKENSGDGVVSALKGGKSGLTGTGSVTFGAGTLGVSGRGAQIGVRVGRIG